MLTCYLIQFYLLIREFITDVLQETFLKARGSRREVFCKKGVLRNFTKFNSIKKETLAQVFTCELCEIFKNTFFHRTPLVAASGKHKSLRHQCFSEISELFRTAILKNNRGELLLYCLFYSVRLVD